MQFSYIKENLTEATVVGYIDDIGKQSLGAVCATDGFADEFFQERIDAYGQNKN